MKTKKNKQTIKQTNKKTKKNHNNSKIKYQNFRQM